MASKGPVKPLNLPDGPDIPDTPDHVTTGQLDGIAGHQDKAARVTIKILARNSPARLSNLLLDMATELETGTRVTFVQGGNVALDDTDFRLHRAAMLIALEWTGMLGVIWDHPSPLTFRLLASLLVTS